ncbi:MAG: ABC transporter substrate-binding protein [Protaetiibacter sp.]
MTEKRVRRIARMAIVGAIIGALAACATPPTTVSDDATEDANIRLEDEDTGGTPEPGGRLAFLMRLEPNNIDPHTATESAAYVVMEQVYESLLESVRGELVAGLAEAWEVSDDGLSYTFTLRDATFHSGRKVTADDVKYSIERIMDPATASPRANSFSTITNIEVLDDKTVEFTVSEPTAPLLTMFSSVGSSIVDRDVVEAGGLNGSVDGGTGPFVLAERAAGQQVSLDKYEDYWDPELPYLDGIDMTWSGDDNARAAAIRSGTVDFLWRAAPEFIDSMKVDPELKWYGGAGTLSLHLRLNTSRAPFDDVRVRQAIYFALDRQELLDAANSGQGTVLYAGYLPPDRWGSAKEAVYGEPDLDRARELLAEAGYADGFEASIMAVSTSAFQTRQAEVIQQQLAEIGITITLEFQESTTTSQRASSGDFDMYQTGYTMSADPDERLSGGFVTGGATNYGNWSDPEYDALIAAARSELDPDAREELYSQSETILAERGPAAFTFVTADFDVVRSNVMGYKGDTTPSFRFYKSIWLDQ